MTAQSKIEYACFVFLCLGESPRNLLCLLKAALPPLVLLRGVLMAPGKVDAAFGNGHSGRSFALP